LAFTFGEWVVIPVLNELVVPGGSNEALNPVSNHEPPFSRNWNFHAVIGTSGLFMVMFADMLVATFPLSLFTLVSGEEEVWAVWVMETPGA
jgi:hypothetical protein